MTGETNGINEFPGLFTRILLERGGLLYRATATIENQDLTVEYIGSTPVTAEVRWPVPGMVAELVLVTVDGTVVALARHELTMTRRPQMLQRVTVAPGVWTDIPDTGISVFHEGDASRVVIVDDGEVTVVGWRFRVAPATDCGGE